jgi:hypothetical protein
MADISTAPQASPQASLKITLSRKTVVRVLAVFIVAISTMVDFWLVALLAGSGQGYATTEIVFNLLSVVVFVALGMALWVLADR